MFYACPWRDMLLLVVLVLARPRRLLVLVLLCHLLL